MSMMKGSARLIATMLAAGALLGTTAVPAAAWPLPLTSDDVSFLNAARGRFPGDDDQLLMAGRQMCRLLYTGQSSSVVVDTMSGPVRSQSRSVGQRRARGSRLAVHTCPASV